MTNDRGNPTHPPVVDQSELDPAQPPPVNPDVPSPARVWNVWLGGTDNFPVDRDPAVAQHARSLLSSTREGKTDYLHADLRDPESILAEAARTLDLTRSVGVLLIAVLHFIPDADDPYGVVARLLAGLPSGSYLVVAHAASDLAPEAAAEMTRRNNQTSPVPITPRTQAEVTRFFDGLDLMPPGVVPVSEWDLGDAMDTTIGGLVGYAGIGRKP